MALFETKQFYCFIFDEGDGNYDENHNNDNDDDNDNDDRNEDDNKIRNANDV